MTSDPDKPGFPEMYRIILRCGDWKMKSERYYTAFCASEALEDLYHAFHKGRVHATKVTILEIDQYDRYSNLWVSRLGDALKNLKTIDPKTLIIKTSVTVKGSTSKIILKRG